jgi:hypothetical protein
MEDCAFDQHFLQFDQKCAPCFLSKSKIPKMRLFGEIQQAIFQGREDCSRVTNSNKSCGSF